MTLKSDPNLKKEKLTFCLKNNLKNFGEFDACSGNSENLHFDGVLKYIKFKLKKYRDVD